MSSINLSPTLKKYLKRCLKERFESEINCKLNEDKDVGQIVEELIDSDDIKQLIKNAKSIIKNNSQSQSNQDVLIIEKDNDDDDDDDDDVEVTSFLCRSSSISELSLNDWNSFKPQIDQLEIVLINLSSDKPVHVRLAGFEAILNYELMNNNNDDLLNRLMKLLQEGISDNNRAIFESSLRVYSKLLLSSKSHDVYTNLLETFDIEYHSTKLYETIPNLNSGINFKIFLHEKLLRLLYLIINHQKECCKLLRGVDRIMDEMIDQFVVFLSIENNSNPINKTLSILNLISILEPQANWSFKWIYHYSTRKTFVNALSKSPNLIQNILILIKKNFDELPCSIITNISDDLTTTSSNVFISGETIETFTYLHCLHFLCQLCSCHLGRNLLSECSTESSPPYYIDFTLGLINTLNKLVVSTLPRSIYNESRNALKIILKQQTFPCDSRFYYISLNPLLKTTSSSSSSSTINTNKIWPHTVDILNFIINSHDGLLFLTSENQRSAKTDDRSSKTIYPISIILINTSDLLRQPFAVMDIEHLIDIFKFIEYFFLLIEDINIIENVLKEQFFPSIEYFYSKIDKYSICHENKIQNLDIALKNMLLKIVSNPLGLSLMLNNPLTFEEVIRGSINPLRHTWSSFETVFFISSAAFFQFGRQIIIHLIPYTFSMLLSDISNNLQDPLIFFDPWNSENIQQFLHIMALLSLNTQCIDILLMDTKDENNDENEYPKSFCELLTFSLNDDSPYHGFSLLILETMIWNLDILITLLTIYDLQNKLLKLQENCLLEVPKYREKLIDEDGEEIENLNEKVDDETHVVYVLNEFSYLRHKILFNSYYIRHKLENYDDNNIDKPIQLFSNFPPPEIENVDPILHCESSSELDEFLNECKPGLKDPGWISQLKKAHKSSQNPIKHSTLMNLLEQMIEAIPAVEWFYIFKWDNNKFDYIWLPEDEFGLELAIRCAEDNSEFLENEIKVKNNLKETFETVHKFILYEKMDKFTGFDWFLSTVFVISNGNIENCKLFIKNFVRCPSAIYIWNYLGVVVDQSNNNATSTLLILAEHIDSVVSQELPTLNYALRKEFGIKWWMISIRLLTQCFWGVLEWPEIIHFLAICISNPPDYIVYYCVSLLNHCQPILMKDIIKKKYWPEHMSFKDFRCHQQMGFMERLAKRHRNKILPSLIQRKLIIKEDN